ncbi:MAG: branched-chain amino acid ABC transporter permease [Acidobacteria bacterium]|nr:branched-chain amino acid ABC transporter permease [Acidobacteriota bacterium]
MIYGLIAGMLYSLVALGYSLIYNATKVFHIAHGAIYTAAAYLLLALSYAARSVFRSTGGLSLAIIIILALLLSCLLGFLFEKVVYSALFKRKAPPLVTFISSLGLYIVTTNLITLLFGNDTKILESSIEPTIAVANTIITRIQAIQLFVSVVLISSVLFLLSRSSLGRQIRAISDNATLASLLGIDVKKTRLLVFALGSFLAASASLLRAFDIGIDPHAGLSVVLTAVVAVIIGGVNSNIGAVVGAMFLGITQNIVTWFFSAQWQDATTFFILILVLLIRREGIFATQLRLEER